ncbi:hypothetical protein FBU30_010213 [Linnemannia zychae]|nr:hypothetical protein FBU30_010213 [Linnemannia zychae]
MANNHYISNLQATDAKCTYPYDHRFDTHNQYEPYDDRKNDELENIYGDYDDIYLTPSSLHKSKPKRNRNNNKSKIIKKSSEKVETIQPFLDVPTLPELPIEVLEVVCVHLSQTTLRYSVNLVCKKWNEVSNRFIHRAAVCAPATSAQDNLLQQWSKFDSLELCSSYDPAYPSIRVQDIAVKFFLTHFLSDIVKPISSNVNLNSQQSDNNNNIKESTTPQCLFYSIRHLKMCSSSVCFSDIIPQLRGHLQFIESLTIDTQCNNADLPLFGIMEDCPFLKNLSITGSRFWMSQLKHGDAEDNAVNIPRDRESYADWVIPPPRTFQERYHLQQFIIKGVVTTLFVLERLLVTCPDLRVFNVFSANVDIYTDTLPLGPKPNTRQRLIHAALKHCKKLECYNFHQPRHIPVDTEYLDEASHLLPEFKTFALSFGGYRENITPPMRWASFLSRITTLELQPDPLVIFNSEWFNRVLCYTPNLVHLFTIKATFHTCSLRQPPAPSMLLTFATMRDRKRHERNERRQARQKALARFKSTPASPNNENIDSPQSNEVSSYSDFWQFYNLKTFEMGFASGSNFETFTTYISYHGLFRNLIRLHIQVVLLKIGQRKTFIDPKKSNTFVGTSLGVCSVGSNTNSDKNQRSNTMITSSEPERYPNELLSLRELQCLEECILRTPEVPGLVLVKDFEFLRRRSDFQTIRSLPKKHFTNHLKTAAPADKSNFTGYQQFTSTPLNRKNKSVATSGDSQQNKDGRVQGKHNDDNEVDHDLKNMEQQDRKTIWPMLNAFHVYYEKISPLINVEKLSYGIGRIRPGVSVRVQQRYVPVDCYNNYNA